MSSAKPLPRSLEGWIKHLDGVRLPVPAPAHERVRRALGDSRRSLRDIADLTQESPALALSLLREANAAGRLLSSPADSLEVALTRLGLQRAEVLLNRLPAVPEEDIPQALRQLLLIGQHAAQQANGLFAARLARLWQEIHWCSLLFLSPLWPLLANHPDLFATWERRVMAEGEPAGKVERELLGVPLLRLCQGLAEHWKLPDWIAQGYRQLSDDRRLLVQALHIARDNEHPLHQQQALDANPTLSRWLTHPGNSVLLANGLAVSAHAGWSDDHSLRWQRLTGLFMKLPLGEVQQLVHQQAAQSARQHARPGLWHPAEALLWPWSEHRLRREPPPAPTPTAGALEDWRRHCGELIREPSPFANVVQLSACARDALQSGGMGRVLVLLADRTHSRLVVQQQAGLPREANGLQLDPAQSQVLRRLLSQAGQLRLGPDNAAQFSALLPGQLKGLFAGDHLLLRSLAVNGRVAMLVVADQGGAPFADISLRAFAKTAQCIERALSSFTKRGR
ncbi:HDOD domain-containing protein [Metapseudomonas furukawaii]|uniref:Predicted signal transduction protein n=1 Tax=Metapseudomonas furukawaii TaxID=1149133 RepID=A0AAD1C578_METFU|nr:HDOD domain-containing protein [Pseudomonas furukawaii]ELS27005.1 putative signal transduction protein [Pseudomonas furukawaii]BAU76898.1 predicted signal transduction protein [Pseudomonas furukawaii]